MYSVNLPQVVTCTFFVLSRHQMSISAGDMCYDCSSRLARLHIVPTPADNKIWRHREGGLHWTLQCDAPSLQVR